MPQPERLLATLQQAVQAFRSTPGRAGWTVRLPAGTEVMVVGDLHGSVENFRLALKQADLGRQAQRHLVLQEVVHGPFRYPQGGDKSHQLLDLVAALKCQYPERVHFLLGNHELSQWLGHRIGKGDVDQNDIFRAGVDEAYGAFAAQIYQAYLDVFAVANLALFCANRVLVTHSLPTAKQLANFDPAKLFRDDLPPEEFRLGGVVHSLVWGRDLSQANAEAFLRKMDADLLITGHIPCPQGYLVPNDRQVVVDAIGTPACYCMFPTDRPLSQQDLLQCIGVL